MRFSTTMEYAIHGLIYLARVPPSKTVLVSDVAAATGVSEGYLRKVFQQLARSGILASQRGARGGFRLVRDARLISLKDVVESIDGSLPVYTCLKVLRGCRLTVSCPVHEAFEKARLRMAEVLEAVSIKDLLVDIARKQPAPAWLKVTA